MVRVLLGSSLELRAGECGRVVFPTPRAPEAEYGQLWGYSPELLWDRYREARMSVTFQQAICFDLYS